MVLVSLVGDYDFATSPILYQYKNDIVKHILIADNGTRTDKKLRRILKGEKHLKKSEKLKYKLISLRFNKSDFKSIKNCYKQILMHAKCDISDIYFNATDGLTTVAMVIGQKLLKKGATVLAYDSYENRLHRLKRDFLTSEPITENLNIKNHLALRGYKILSYYHRFDMIKRKRFVLKLAKDLRIYKEFAKHFPIYDRTKFSRFNSILQNFDMDEKSATNFIRGVVFEEYIYHLVNDNLKVDDIMCGVTIEFDDGHVNEFDILIMKDNHLHTIECKFANNINAENSVYKLDSIKHYLDDESKGMLLVVSEGDVNFSTGTLSRAKSGEIRIHHSKEFNKKHFLIDIKEWFDLEYKGMLDLNQENKS
jgi:hypothetical protein